MTRSNIALSILLAIQIALVALALRPGATAPPAQKHFFANTGKQAVSAIEIGDGNATLRLEKQETGWFVKADPDYPADSDKIDRLLGKLTGLASSRLVARTPASHVRLKVADEVFNRKVELTANGRTTTLFLGSSPSYKTLHVRLAGEDEVYLVKDLSVWEVQANKESWWATRYLDMDPAELVRLELRNPAGDLVLERKPDAESPWRLAGEPDKELDPRAVDDLLAAAGRITLLSYLGTEEKEAYGLADPAVTLALATREGKTVTVRIGRKRGDENDHVAKRDDSPFYVSVAAYAVEKLLGKKAASLLAAAAKEKEAATGGDKAKDGKPAAADSDAAPPAADTPNLSG